MWGWARRCDSSNSSQPISHLRELPPFPRHPEHSLDIRLLSFLTQFLFPSPSPTLFTQFRTLTLPSWSMGITASLLSLLPVSTQLNGVVPITVGLESSDSDLLDIFKAQLWPWPSCAQISSLALWKPQNKFPILFAWFQKVLRYNPAHSSKLISKVSPHYCTHFAHFSLLVFIKGFPGGSEVKASACNAGDPGSIPRLGRSPGEGNGNPLQYSCLENPMDRGAWWAAVHGVTKSQTQLSNFTFQAILPT